MTAMPVRIHQSLGIACPIIYPPPMTGSYDANRGVAYGRMGRGASGSRMNQGRQREMLLAALTPLRAR
jgi:hypothetical protein